MPLIKCPMCGKDISPNAVSCPNCGEPMKKIVQDEIGKEVDKEVDNDKYSLILNSRGDDVIKTIKLIRNITNCGLRESKKCCDTVPSIIINDISYEDAEKIKNSFDKIGAKMDISKTGVISDSYDISERGAISNNYVINSSSDEIQCPNCHSTKVHKIGGISKAGSVVFFGIFALGKLNKTYECKKCKYRW